MNDGPGVSEGATPFSRPSRFSRYSRRSPSWGAGGTGTGRGSGETLAVRRNGPAPT
ncbi:hypothetical protein QFZ63_001735 [Streptomyces sp. B3I7]|nr:hypothetical protein [Streptomyces sp. B3I7]